MTGLEVGNVDNPKAKKSGKNPPKITITKS